MQLHWHEDHGADANKDRHTHTHALIRSGHGNVAKRSRGVTSEASRNVKLPYSCAMAVVRFSRASVWPTQLRCPSPKGMKRLGALPSASFTPPGTYSASSCVYLLTQISGSRHLPPHPSKHGHEYYYSTDAIAHFRDQKGATCGLLASRQPPTGNTPFERETECVPH